MRDPVVVKIFSFGQKWGFYPNGPDDKTLQFIVDVRGKIPDPAEHFPALADGTTPEVRRWVLVQEGVIEWLDRLVQIVEAWFNEAYLGEYVGINIFFMCTGGFQRSVVVAEVVAKKFALWDTVSLHGPIVTHVTMSLAIAQKTAALKNANPQ